MGVHGSNLCTKGDIRDSITCAFGKMKETLILADGSLRGIVLRQPFALGFSFVLACVVLGRARHVFYSDASAKRICPCQAKLGLFLNIKRASAALCVFQETQILLGLRMLSTLPRSDLSQSKK